MHVPLDPLRYPVGKFQLPHPLTAQHTESWIAEISALPGALRAAVAGLTENQLDTPYRPEGWTVRQVVHHVPDSHLNAYLRCKFALTEHEPTIKAYAEDRWAELADGKSGPVAPSLQLLAALHERWVRLLRSLSSADLARRYTHPDTGVKTLGETIGLYAWHGRHHVAHITTLRQRMGWMG
ncbi:MAG: YfiT family bacillithiol transferase [Terriglobales bacterium]